MENMNKILDKIKKCLALSASSEPHEAAAVMARAQDLMAKYGISAEVLEPKVTPDQVVEQGLRSIATATRVKAWEPKLYRAVADAFGCTLLFVRGIDPGVLRQTGQPAHLRYATYNFVGLREEAQVARYVAEVLQRQLSRARATYTKTVPETIGGYVLRKGDKTAHVDSYCAGWVAGAVTKVEPLSARRQAVAKQAEADGTAAPGTALMAVSKEDQSRRAIEDYMSRYARSSSQFQGSRGHVQQAREHGYNDGLKAEVNRAIGTGAARAYVRG